LFCAGATVFSPLTHFGAGPGKKVGIVGIGGLGHLGLKFARALGAEVFAISTSASKEEEAKKLGAHHFINTKDKDSVAKVRTKELIRNNFFGESNEKFVCSTKINSI
jgi:D-arabinose 1-dehydrogenase-like Zn-dependent alcohol dehydrogenase